MIPPFPTVDHCIDSSPLPYEERRVVRRSAPERLLFDLPSSGYLDLKPTAQHPPEPIREARQGRFARFAATLRLWAPA